jgi:hypothetical protein
MADRLGYEVALRLARQLKAIPNFPWDEDVIAAHAQHLIRWCKGAIVDGRVWPAEAQAHWLVTEVQETWVEKWLGTGAMKQLFDARFTHSKVPANGFQPLGEKPPILCSSCNDTGIVRVRGKHRYCDCELGDRMKADSGENGDKWLQRMDRSFVTSFVSPVRRKPNPTIQDLEAEYFEQHPQKPAEAS